MGMEYEYEAWDQDEEEDSAVVWICRDIPGDHVGGPKCFCGAYPMNPNDEADCAKVEQAIADGSFNRTN